MIYLNEWTNECTNEWTNECTNECTKDECTKECPICYETEKNINIYNDCVHQICTDCLKNTLKSLPEHKNLTCALCRNPITQITALTTEEATKLFQIILGLA